MLVLIAGIWGLSKFQRTEVTDPAETVDYTAELAEARDAAPFEVLAPVPTLAGWRATSADWEGVGPEVSWHLGLLTGAGEYVGLEQGNAPADDFIEASTPATSPDDPVTVGGQTWDALVSDDGQEHALVQRVAGVTTVVTGTASVEELVAFAESLTAS